MAQEGMHTMTEPENRPNAKWAAVFPETQNGLPFFRKWLGFPARRYSRVTEMIT
jgi:hypothetical protein